MVLVDSHCHLDSLDLTDYGNSLSLALKAAEQVDVKHFLCVGLDLESFPSMYALVKDRDNVSVSVGVHPLHVDKKEHEDEAAQSEVLQGNTLDVDLLSSFARRSKVVAVGETGLDYFYSPDNKVLQQAMLSQHVQVAREVSKPIIVHSRGAKQDTLAILNAEHAREVGGVLHCFTEDLDMAKQAIELGFYISFSGIVTFKNATSLKDVVRQLPLENMLIETDSPYLAPVPHRGQPNQPKHVVHVAECIAEIKQVALEEVVEATTRNFEDLFSVTVARD
ncbi:MAG: hypothetical protein COB04_06580 [Gammaproteobacteria bacterium]|nr:MAG: hypothetical protein COB04_06580 [Gammaproteobacteria bacterium]